MLVVGIDVGGTQIKFGLVENGNIIKSMELGTNAFDIIRQLCNGARELVQSSGKAWEDVDGIAIGFPGMVINSIVMDSPNVSLQNCNLKEILEKELGKYVVVKNDAEMATLAEHKLGAGADCENMVMITLGTGVGGGIIVNRKLYVGTGGAGELGHILFERNGRACSCGRKGCAEQYVSMVALDKLAKDIMVGYPNTCVDFNGDGVVFASEVIKAYKKNDACAIAIAERFVDDLTQYLLDLCNIFRPNRIVIGGGVTHAPELIDMVARNCRRLEYGYKNSPKVDILAAQLGNKAGVLGGYVCLEEELKDNIVDEEYINEIEEEINADSQNMSLLDSIALRLDKPVMENPVEDVDTTEQEETSGLYVNKFLDDISSEINTIKNEQLFEDNNVEQDKVDNAPNFDAFANIFEPVSNVQESTQDEAYEEPIGTMYQEPNNSMHTEEPVNYGFTEQEFVAQPQEQGYNMFEKNESVREEVFEPVSQNNEPAVVEAYVEEEQQNGITVDSLLESLKNTTANLNSAMNKFGDSSASIVEPVSNEVNTFEQYDSNAGISDIFFGSSDAQSEPQTQGTNIYNDDAEYNNVEYSEEEMQETEVVYDDNLLSRVNAMLTKKNQE